MFVAAVMWSTGGLFIKSINWTIAGGRSDLVAALFMLVVVGKPRLTRSRALWIGAVAYAATVIGFVLANKLTTSANAILLQFPRPHLRSRCSAHGCWASGSPGATGSPSS